MDDFENTNKTYKRLQRNKDIARSKVYRIRENEHQNLAANIRRLKTQIHMKGVTPSVVREVQALIKKVTGS